MPIAVVQDEKQCYYQDATGEFCSSQMAFVNIGFNYKCIFSLAHPFSSPLTCLHGIYPVTIYKRSLGILKKRNLGKPFLKFAQRVLATWFTPYSSFSPIFDLPWGAGNSHMKGTGMLIGKFELCPQRSSIWAWLNVFLTQAFSLISLDCRHGMTANLR